MKSTCILPKARLRIMRRQSIRRHCAIRRGNYIVFTSNLWVHARCWAYIWQNNCWPHMKTPWSGSQGICGTHVHHKYSLRFAQWPCKPEGGGGSNVSMIICVRVNCLLRKLIKTKTLDKALKASDWFEIGFNHANARFEERAICF